MKKGNIYNKLNEYGRSDSYPYHMPGHKRNVDAESGLFGVLGRIGDIDITEIHDFDNLSDPDAPDGILYKAQKECADFYDVKKSFYLVNGSTVGILSAISACVPKGGKLCVARNAHKSTYNAMCIRDIEPVYMYPHLNKQFGFFEAVTAEDVEKAICSANSDCEINGGNSVAAVIVVSPTYEGRIADIKAISEVAHSYGIPLIVDEAHGAHLKFAKDADKFGISACDCGADIVIQSVHKTLPAPTQTAVMHFNSELVSLDKLEKYLHVYQTSSPSYPLMAGIEEAINYMKEFGQERLEFLKNNFVGLVATINTQCKYIEALDYRQGIQDVGKLVFSAKRAGISGIELSGMLRDKYHLELEMCVKDYCLAMFTVCDAEEAFDRMKGALLDIDRQLQEKLGNSKFDYSTKPLSSYSGNETVIPLAKAWDMSSERIFLEHAAGRVCAAFVGLYPPGTPMLVPGEPVSEENVREIMEYITLGYEVTGINEGLIKVICQ